MEKFYKIGQEETESIEYFLRNETWSGAKDRIDTATDEQITATAERIAEYYSDSEAVSETTLNDLVWFECDDIFYPEEEEEESEDEEENE
jgi:hypothetical protein